MSTSEIKWPFPVSSEIMLGHRSLSSGKKKWVKGLQSDHARKIRCIMNIQEKKGGQFPENCIILHMLSILYSYFGCCNNCNNDFDVKLKLFQIILKFLTPWCLGSIKFVFCVWYSSATLWINGSTKKFCWIWNAFLALHSLVSWINLAVLFLHLMKNCNYKSLWVISVK